MNEVAPRSQERQWCLSSFPAGRSTEVPRKEHQAAPLVQVLEVHHGEAFDLEMYYARRNPF